MKNTSRILLWTVLFIVLLSVAMGSTQANAKDFTDVKKSHPNYTAIQYMQEKGYISGYPDGTFRPQESISRKHVAKLLNNALDLPKYNTNTSYYDVPASHPYYVPIMKLTTAGIFSGDLDGYFYPEASVTRIQMAKLLDISFDLYMTQQNGFYDVYLEHWGYTHANAVKASGVASGYPDGEFKLNESVTRAHYAQFLYAAIKVKEARPVTDKVTKGKAWDIVNRKTFELEKTLREARMLKWKYSDIAYAFRPYATDTFVDNALKTYYDPNCEDCYSNVLPYINFEPLVRFDFTQPDASTLNVNTVEFQNGYSVGGYVAYQFKKQGSAWKMNSLNFTPVGTKNFKLTIKEAEKVLEAEYTSYGQKNVDAKYITTTQQIELDPVTDAKYTFDQYTFNIDSSYGRIKVKFNSSDGFVSYQ